MQIIEKNIDELKPYARNARNNTKAVDLVGKSIDAFGFRNPILIEEDGTIVAGHTRYEAMKKRNARTVPCIIVDGLNQEEIKAFRLADNKTAEAAEWDWDLLDEEINSIMNFDMSDFGFEVEEIIDLSDEDEGSGDEGPDDTFADGYDEPREDNEKVSERTRTGKAYKLDYYDEGRTEGKYDMPLLKASSYVPEDLIGFNYARTSQEYSKGIHFFLDDYQFERIWNKPEENIDVIRQFSCALTPDFSLYMDMPVAMMIWNTYRSRLVGQMMQDAGIEVIPTVSWAGSNSFDFAFDGLPKEGTVAISTIGVIKDPECFEVWKAGMDELMRRKNPKRILLYGTEVDYDFGNAEVITFKNQVTERLAHEEDEDRD